MTDTLTDEKLELIAKCPGIVNRDDVLTLSSEVRRLRELVAQLLECKQRLENACDDFQRLSEIANREADEAQRENSELWPEIRRLRERAAELEGALRQAETDLHWLATQGPIEGPGPSALTAEDVVTKVARALEDNAEVVEGK